MSKPMRTGRPPGRGGAPCRGGPYPPPPGASTPATHRGRDLTQTPIGFVSASPSSGSRGRWARGEGSCPDPYWLRFGRGVAFVRAGGWVRSAPGVEFVRRGAQFVREPAVEFVRRGAQFVRAGGWSARRPSFAFRRWDCKPFYPFVNQDIRDNGMCPRHEDRVRSRRRLGSFGAGIEFVRAGHRVRSGRSSSSFGTAARRGIVQHSVRSAAARKTIGTGAGNRSNRSESCPDCHRLRFVVSTRGPRLAARSSFPDCHRAHWPRGVLGSLGARRIAPISVRLDLPRTAPARRPLYHHRAGAGGRPDFLCPRTGNRPDPGGSSGSRIGSWHP